MNKAIFVTISLVAFVLSVFASNAAVTNQNRVETAKSSCEQQAWPRFSQDCLMSINGEKSERQFRMISD